MKKTLLFIGIALFCIACKKMNCCTPPASAKTFITAQKDGGAWSALIDSASIRNDTLEITGDIPNSYLHSGPWPETLRITVKNVGTGIYKLTKNQVLYITQFGPDLVPAYDLYIDSAFNNTLTINNYDQANNIVAGTFNLRFVNNSNPSTTSYITFSDGKFDVALRK